ncbi:hypothetical protein [uncultured Limosilactobacillus sp.]|uniref:hypothetical protein n=1 Tax=uncultured Limosilactobacillus sp. TaxID=2837629 RepID=UPI0026365923|nr:hypothetical protein [uncultured Limosilactobacillus sp.]
MNRHQTSNQDQWFHSRYDGEDRDDGCQNELSIKPNQEDTSRLEVLLTNVGFNGETYDNTFSLTREDAEQLRDFLNQWLNQ